MSFTIVSASSSAQTLVIDGATTITSGTLGVNDKVELKGTLGSTSLVHRIKINWRYLG